MLLSSLFFLSVSQECSWWEFFFLSGNWFSCISFWDYWIQSWSRITQFLGEKKSNLGDRWWLFSFPSHSIKLSVRMPVTEAEWASPGLLGPSPWTSQPLSAMLFFPVGSEPSLSTLGSILLRCSVSLCYYGSKITWAFLVLLPMQPDKPLLGYLPLQLCILAFLVRIPPVPHSSLCWW